MDCYLTTILPRAHLESLQMHQLNCAMAFRDFENEICIDNCLHRLPPFEYIHDDTATAEKILSKAREATRIAGIPRARIFVARLIGGWTDQIVA